MLRLPDALNDNLAGGLGGDASEILGADLAGHHVAQLDMGQAPAGILQGDLGVGVIHHLNYIPADHHADDIPLLVGNHRHVVSHALVVPLIGGGQGLADLFQHVFLFDAPLFFQLIQGQEKFPVVLLLGVFSFLCSLSHLDYTPLYQTPRRRERLLF